GAGASPSSSSTIITPGAVPTGSLPPINSYPVTGPTASGTASAPAGGSGGNGAAGGGGGSGTGGGSGSGSGSVGGVPVGSTGCVLSVQVQLDKTSPSGPPVYASGQDPAFNVILRNQGTGNCRFDVSGKGVVVTVTSVDSNAQVWSSAICNTSKEDLRVLGPADGFTEPVKWTRVQSPAGCAATPQPVGAGSYAVTAAVSGVSAASVQFTLQ
ncbi:hypothetical protein KGA66_18425, partial [Actinocrinis puniceicyclus]